MNKSMFLAIGLCFLSSLAQADVPATSKPSQIIPSFIQKTLGTNEKTFAMDGSRVVAPGGIPSDCYIQISAVENDSFILLGEGPNENVLAQINLARPGQVVTKSLLIYTPDYTVDHTIAVNYSQTVQKNNSSVSKNLIIEVVDLNLRISITENARTVICEAPLVP